MGHFQIYFRFSRQCSLSKIMVTWWRSLEWHQIYYKNWFNQVNRLLLTRMLPLYWCYSLKWCIFIQNRFQYLIYNSVIYIFCVPYDDNWKYVSFFDNSITCSYGTFLFILFVYYQEIENKSMACDYTEKYKIFSSLI